MFTINGNHGPITVQGPVTFRMDDNGGAHVEMTLAAENMPPVTNNLTYRPAVDVPMPLKRGKYHCAMVVKAFSYGALNRAYDSILEVNGTPVATAKGTLPAGGADFGSFLFDLVVQ